ncbi:MAG: GTP-binding protein [Bacteroidetes bacterium SW_9_63_38]|nr:MAG: GTP-binding protein [Bacteroidetes bacterium SW_9_63_38]
MLDQATFELGVAQWDQFPTDERSEIAFVGRSNVGKSSLLNALLGRKNLAYTSKTPGKTQQLNFFRVDNRFYAVDLPGYGYAKAPKSARVQWAQLQDRYLHEREPLCGVVQLIDARHPPQDSDVSLMEELAEESVPHLLALTKADKLSGNGRAQTEHRMDDRLADLGLDRPVVLTSAESNRGVGEVRRWIESQLNG